MKNAAFGSQRVTGWKEKWKVICVDSEEGDYFGVKTCYLVNLTKGHGSEKNVEKKMDVRCGTVSSWHPWSQPGRPGHAAVGAVGDRAVLTNGL